MSPAEKSARKLFKAKVLSQIPQGNSEEMASRTYHEDLEKEGLIANNNGKWELTLEGQRIVQPALVTLPLSKKMSFAYGASMD